MTPSDPPAPLTGLKSTNKGLIILLVAAVAAGAVWGIVGYVQKVRTSAQLGETWSNIRWVNMALHNYHATHQRFPAQLETLTDPGDGYPPLLLPRHREFPGYRMDYDSTGNGYAIRLIPEDPQGVHFYTDQTVVIRFRQGAPAGADSPEWTS